MARDDLLERCPRPNESNPDLTLTRVIGEEEPRTGHNSAQASRRQREARPRRSAGSPRRELAAARLAIDDVGSRPRGPAHPAGLHREWAGWGTAQTARSRHPRAFAHERNAGLALQRTRRQSGATWLIRSCSARFSPRSNATQHNENSRGSRLRDLLLDDRELHPGHVLRRGHEHCARRHAPAHAHAGLR